MHVRWSRILAELRRRHVVRVAAIYGVAAWFTIEVTATTFPLLHLPEAWATRVVVLALLGLPIAVVLAWIFDLTPEGVHRTAPAAEGGVPARHKREARSRIALLFPLLLLFTAVLWVRFGEGPAGQAAEAATAGSIAVLPFANLSADADNAYFAGGIHDEILTQLAHVAELRVIGRSSVLDYAQSNKQTREIGGELGVGTVLTGSVQRDRSRVRVAVHLIDVKTERVLWSETYDRELVDVFAIQSEIAQKIVTALKGNLSARERAQLAHAPTVDPEAYTFYLRAQEYYRRPNADRVNLENAVRLYGEAVRLDPGFAIAHARLADAHGAMYWFGYDPSPERLRQQRTAVERALQLAPTLPEVREASGMYHYRMRDYKAALAEFEVARQAMPNSPYLAARIAYVYRRQGRWQQATDELQAAVRLNPRDADLFRDLALTLHAHGRYAEADAAYLRSLALAPDNFRAAIRRGQLFLDWQGTTDTLRASLGAVTAGQEVESTVSYGRWYLAMLNRRYLEATQAVAGDSGAILSSQEYYLPGSFLAGVAYARAGERARAAQSLEAARLLLEQAVQEVPSDHRRHLALGRVLAELGRATEAIAAGRRGMELLSASDDALQGPLLALDLVEIYARTGQSRQALELLESLPRTGLITANRLRLDPRWDPLRANPRFRRVVERRSRNAPAAAR